MTRLIESFPSRPAARIRAILAASLLLVATAAIAEPGFELTFHEILQSEYIPGAAMAVVRGDRIDTVATHGVRASGRPETVTPDTVFRIASVSKTFAAQLAAMAVADGLIDWSDSVSTYLPEFRLANPAMNLTIHHLLSQSSGVVPNAYDNLVNAGQELERIVPRFAELEPMCAPGTCYTYQNVLFSMIGPVLEQTYQHPYDRLLEWRVFRPLGMDTATSGLEGYLATENRAWPHVRPGRGPVWFATEVNANYYRVSPAAGVNASVTDLSKWLIAQLGHQPEVIDSGSVQMLTTPQVRTARELRRRAWRGLLDDAHYGLGWRIYRVGDETLIMHNGWVRGFVAGISYSPERQVGLAVLINAESSALNDVVTAFWQQEMARPVQRIVEQEIDSSDFGLDPAVKGGD